jgi:hypothetical protein
MHQRIFSDAKLHKSAIPSRGNLQGGGNSMSDIIDLLPDAAANLPTTLPVERGGPKLEARRAKPREQRLTARQNAFVEALITNGGDRVKAAIAAGCNKKSAAAMAWKWLRHPLIAEEVVRRTTELVASAAPAAVQRMVTLMNKSKSDFVRMQAAQDILNRAGVGRDTKAPTAPLVVNINLG